MGLKRTSGDPVRSAKAFSAQVRAGAREGVAAASLVFVGVIKETLSTPGRGAIRRGGRERAGIGSFTRGEDGNLSMVRRGTARTNIDITNRASLPGDPPAPDTGALRNSIDFEMTSDVSSRVGTNSKYAEPLEFGTTRMAPRPFMRPSLVVAAPLMGPAIVEEIKRAGEDNG
jgi:hypothetical protein